MRIILTVFLTFVLTACGFKGPLFLPEPTKKGKSPPPQAKFSQKTAVNAPSKAKSSPVSPPMFVPENNR
jgi:predicted small lipoprotein YifL